MIDTHAHLDTDAFNEDREEVLKRSFDSGVEYIIMPAIEPATFDSLIAAAMLDERLFIGAGIHPHNANEVDKSTLEKVEKLSANAKCVAIGEVGLDYYYDFAKPEVQKKAFADQIDIARQQKLPLIIHNRDSGKDLLEILKERQDGSLRGVMHCFSGDLDFLKKSLDLGFHVSFTGNITFKKSELTEVVSYVPSDRYMLETDSPYMTPVPFRGKRNEPSYIKIVAEKIAEIKSISIDEVFKMTSKTAKLFFNLPLLAVFMLISLFSIATAQDEADESEAKIEVVNPYKKFIGIGILGGTNTIVETYSPDDHNVTYEGIAALGGSIYYSPIDYLTVNLSYIYSQNTKFAAKIKNLYGTDVDPNINNIYEFTVHVTPNPASRVNVFFDGGITELFNKYGRNNNGVKSYLNDNKLGVNTGLGFDINVQAGNGGLFVITAEWKLHFIMGKTHLNFDPSTNDFTKSVDISTFYSIPRIGIIWYPKF